MHFRQDFNPRSRAGSDRYLDKTKRIKREISIHAPAQGATAKTPIFFYNWDFYLSKTNKTQFTNLI